MKRCFVRICIVFSAILAITLLSGCTVEKADMGMETETADRVMIEIEGDGGHLELARDSNNPSLYIANITFLEEFSDKNEGSVILYTDSNIIEFCLTKATGTVTGAVDGPAVKFKMDLSNNDIIERAFEPAPMYENPESEHLSGEVLELADERLVEIGLIFKRIMEENL